MAVATLVGSGGPPKETPVSSGGAGSNVWAQSQLQRQQVLDSLFAKRLQKEDSSSGKDSSDTEAKVLLLSCLPALLTIA